MASGREEERLVVTGAGMCSALGAALAECLGQAGAAAKSAALPIRAIPEDYLRTAGEEPILFRLDKATKMVLNVTGQCLQQAGWREAYSVETGLASGSFLGSFSSNVDFIRTLTLEGPKSLDPEAFPPTSHNYPVSIAAIRFKLCGPVVALLNTLVAGTQALVQAAQLLRAGRVPRMLVLGFEEADEVIAKMIEKNHAFFQPLLRDQGSAGCFMEGCAGLLLETRASAAERGSGVLAEFSGYDQGFAPRGAENSVLPGRIDQLLGRLNLDAGSIAWRGPAFLEKQLARQLRGPNLSWLDKTGHHLGAAGLADTVLTLAGWKDLDERPWLLVDQDPHGNFVLAIFKRAKQGGMSNGR